MSIFKRVAFSSLLLGVVVAAGFFAGDYYHKANMKKAAHSAAHSHVNFHELLNLTEDQQNRLIPIEKKYAEQKAFYENQIRLANGELGDIMKREKAYTPEVQAAVEKVHTAMGELQKVTLIHLFDMRALLDEEQARVFDNFVADAMHGL